MTGERDDVRAELALEAKLIDWQVYRAPETRSGKKVSCVRAAPGAATRCT